MFLSNARISNAVDLDNDGYARSFDLTFDVSPGLLGETYYVKVYEDDGVHLLDDLLFTSDTFFSMASTQTQTISVDCSQYPGIDLLGHGQAEIRLDLYDGATGTLANSSTPLPVNVETAAQDWILSPVSDSAALQQTDTEIFHGNKWSVLADFSSAAYKGDGKQFTEQNFETVKNSWALLGCSEPLDAGYFDVDHVYRNLNASAVVAVCKNAAVISFTGSNDIDDYRDDVVGMLADYKCLLPLIRTFDQYIADADHGITHVYVTGHSLNPRKLAYLHISQSALCRPFSCGKIVL